MTWSVAEFLFASLTVHSLFVQSVLEPSVWGCNLLACTVPVAISVGEFSSIVLENDQIVQEECSCVQVLNDT